MAPRVDEQAKGGMRKFPQDGSGSTKPSDCRWFLVKRGLGNYAKKPANRNSQALKVIIIALFCNG